MECIAGPICSGPDTDPIKVDRPTMTDRHSDVTTALGEGEALIRANEPGAVAFHADLAIRFPNDARVAFAYAGSMDSAGDEHGALEEYRRALALGLPDDLRPRLYVQMGSTLRNVGDVAGSVALLVEGVEAFPDDLAMACFLALARHKAGQPGAAVAEGSAPSSGPTSAASSTCLATSAHCAPTLIPSPPSLRIDRRRRLGWLGYRTRKQTVRAGWSAAMRAAVRQGDPLWSPDRRADHRRQAIPERTITMPASPTATGLDVVETGAADVLVATGAGRDVNQTGDPAIVVKGEPDLGFRIIHCLAQGPAKLVLRVGHDIDRDFLDMAGDPETIAVVVVDHLAIELATGPRRGSRSVLRRRLGLVRLLGAGLLGLLLIRAEKLIGKPLDDVLSGYALHDELQAP